MVEKQEWRIEELSVKHHRHSFSCGSQDLDDYLKYFASQDRKRRIGRIFVASIIQPSFDIIGYYTISAASFKREELPRKDAKKLPHYPVPAAIIGRLAVDRSWQGRGIGKFLLMDALDRIVSASKIVAINAIVVDAKNEKAKSFYERYGFTPFPNAAMRLFIPMKTVESVSNHA